MLLAIILVPNGVCNAFEAVVVDSGAQGIACLIVHELFINCYASICVLDIQPRLETIISSKDCPVPQEKTKRFVGHVER